MRPLRRTAVATALFWMKLLDQLVHSSQIRGMRVI